VSITADEVKDYQQRLATLGYYQGAIDGIAGPATKTAVKNYQAGHPDLVVDGIVGPATRASLERDIKARSAPAQGAATGAASAVVTAVTVAGTGGSHAVWWAIGIGVLLAAVAGLVIYLKNRR
jgi:peptidoglycan hydrolase-like protein with peptidoglycan-binding domain